MAAACVPAMAQQRPILVREGGNSPAVGPIETPSAVTPSRPSANPAVPPPAQARPRPTREPSNPPRNEARPTPATARPPPTRPVTSSAGGLASRFCRNDGHDFRWAPGEHTLQVTMSVASNGQCRINYTIPGADALGVVRQPSNGTLQLLPRNGLLYKPRAGFTGQDSFTIRARESLVNSTLLIVRTVTVGPAR